MMQSSTTATTTTPTTTKSTTPSTTTSTNRRRIQELLWNQLQLCNLPIFILVIVASLDNADKQLLASSFPVLEKTLHLSVETLGYFSLFSNLSYALSLPLWSGLVHVYGMAHIHSLLSSACLSWGISTVGIAVSGNSVLGQAVFRALNGVALGSILPLSQTLLVDMVQIQMRGRAFGWMGLCEKLAGTVAAASVFYFQYWQTSYYVLGAVSIVMSAIAWIELTPRKRRMAKSNNNNNKKKKKKNPMTTWLLGSPTNNKNKDSGSDHEEEDEELNDESKEHDGDDPNHQEPQLTMRQIIQRITRVPAFLCLVAQGIFGGTPWDMMSFMIMLLDWRQFTSEQIITIQFTTGISATIGGWLGGLLGDYYSEAMMVNNNNNNNNNKKGRIYVALISVLGGIPLYGIFLFAKDFTTALVFANLFHLVGTWPPAGALRPICADLARNPSERAQIVSLWIVLEKTSGAVFGAPLVGYLTSHMLMDHQMNDNNNNNNNNDNNDKAFALAWNLFGLSTFFWIVCAGFWIVMAYTIDQSSSYSIQQQHQQQQQHKKMELIMHHKDSSNIQ